MPVKKYEKTIKGFRLVSEPTDIPVRKVDTSQLAADYARQFYLGDIDVYESFFIILLNRANNATSFAKISQGGTVGTVIDIKIIAKYAKYINSADSTFSSVISKLPINGVKKIESAIVAKAFEQYSSKGVIDFIGLDKSLSKATLRTAEAREKQLLISEAARVFRNNPELKEASDKLLLDNAHTAILTDAFNIVWSRLNNMVGKWIYSYVPTQEGRKLNAFRKLDAVLDRPESIKAVRELKATIPKEEHKEIDELVASLRQHQAQRKYLQQISGGNNGKAR